MEFDFIDNIGEGAYYSDEENKNRFSSEEHPADTFIRELREWDELDTDYGGE